MSDVRDLLERVARTAPVLPLDRAARAISLARRRRRFRMGAVGAVLAATALAFVVAGPLAARLATAPQVGPAGIPDRAYPVPLHAPVVGPGAAFGQQAALLLGGVPRATGLVGSGCCSLAVVGASRDVSAFLELPRLVVPDDGALPARLSPDGRAIAYSDGSGVRILSLVDGTERAVAAPDGGVVTSVLGWSGNGLRLLVAVSGSAATGADTGLAAVEADGSGWSRLAVPASWDGTSAAAALSPDGRQVAYVQEEELWVAPTDAGPARRLQSYLPNPQVAWYADGTGVCVLTVAAPPGGVVQPGARADFEVVSLTSRGTTDDHVVVAAESALLPTCGQGDPMFVTGTPGAYVIARYDSAIGSQSSVVHLSAQAQPGQVDVAVELLDGPRRQAGPPADPSRSAAEVALVVGLAVGLAVPLVLLLSRHRRPM